MQGKRVRKRVTVFACATVVRACACVSTRAVDWWREDCKDARRLLSLQVCTSNSADAHVCTQVSPGNPGSGSFPLLCVAQDAGAGEALVTQRRRDLD